MRTKLHTCSLHSAAKKIPMGLDERKKEGRTAMCAHLLLEAGHLCERVEPSLPTTSGRVVMFGGWLR